MVMGSAWRKNNLRELRHSIGRYLAILSIIALGVGFFAGLKAAKPAMLLTGQDYLNETKFYDFRLITTLGLTQDDERHFASLDGVAAAKGAVSVDAVAETGGRERTVKILTLTDRVNLPKLTAGRMPQTASECLADTHRFSEKDLGQTVKILRTSIDGCVSVQEFTIVGLCTSPLYLNVERGTTTLGGGSIEAFLCVPKDAFALDYFTEICLSVQNADRVLYSGQYDTDLDALRPGLTQVLEERAQLRYESIIDDARQALSDAQAEYDRGEAEYKEQRAAAEAHYQATPHQRNGVDPFPNERAS